MRLYLAGPMRGYKDFNYPWFNQVTSFLRGQGHFVFNPTEATDDTGCDPWDYMAVDIAWIASHAEGMVMLEGWSKSKGARLEKALAEYLELPIYYVRNNDIIGTLSAEPAEQDR